MQRKYYVYINLIIRAVKWQISFHCFFRKDVNITCLDISIKYFSNKWRISNVVNGGRVLYEVKRIVNDINTQIGCIDSFEMTTKNLTMEDIKVIFEKMLKEHEASIVQKNQEMFHKQEQSILALKSGNNSLTNQRLDNLSKDTMIWKRV